MKTAFPSLHVNSTWLVLFFIQSHYCTPCPETALDRQFNWRELGRPTRLAFQQQLLYTAGISLTTGGLVATNTT